MFLKKLGKLLLTETQLIEFQNTYYVTKVVQISSKSRVFLNFPEKINYLGLFLAVFLGCVRELH